MKAAEGEEGGECEAQRGEEVSITIINIIDLLLLLIIIIVVIIIIVIREERRR